MLVCKHSYKGKSTTSYLAIPIAVDRHCGYQSLLQFTRNTKRVLDKMKAT